jgi:hypothetical protein
MTQMFTEAFHQYKHWCTQRRVELTNIIGERITHTVQSGPFTGMILLPWWSWGDGDHLPKLLGTYESELYDVAEQVFSTEPDFILNIGSAEGFWGLGAAMRTGVPALLVDLDALALKIARENAQVNNLTDIEFSTDSSCQSMQAVLSQHKKPFLIMDCEGAETTLLDLDAVPALSHTYILVETHDCFGMNISDTLKARFQNTHQIEEIWQGAKNPYLDVVKDFGDHDKMLMCIEGRASTMSWLYLKPITTV